MPRVMNPIRIIKLFIWIGVISLIMFYINYKDFKTEPLLEKNYSVEVSEGDTLRSIFIEDLGLNGTFSKLYLGDIEFNLQQGSYELTKDMTAKEIIETIKAGPLKTQIKVTILPGWNIFDIDEYLSKKGLINKGAFISEAKNIQNYKNKFEFLQNALTLEGFLYPDTYFEDTRTFQISTFTTRLLKTFDQKVYQKLLVKKSSKEIDEIIKIASILEREEPSKSEKPTVAGILIKRYQEKWMIGADITACYAQQYTDDECRLNLSKHIAEKNDYNTRTMVGLPKTPINNPSYDSIYSTINYQTSSYYYYLHNIKSGEIYYAKTLEEHNSNKQYMR